LKPEGGAQRCSEFCGGRPKNGIWPGEKITRKTKNTLRSITVKWHTVLENKDNRGVR